MRILGTLFLYIAVILAGSMLVSCATTQGEPLDECHQLQQDLEMVRRTRYPTYGNWVYLCPGDKLDIGGTQ